jgi:2-iminoacetate synthase ThiH
MGAIVHDINVLIYRVYVSHSLRLRQFQRRDPHPITITTKHHQKENQNPRKKKKKKKALKETLKNIKKNPIKNTKPSI